MYEPADDSFLLEKEVKKYCSENKPSIVIDMGTGSGIQANAAAVFCNQVIAVDIQNIPENIFEKTNIEFVKSDLFSDVSEKYFNQVDLIIFNAPYLPQGEEDYNAKELYGGHNGVDLTIEFLIQAKKFLSSFGAILFVASSHADIKFLEEKMVELGFEFKVVTKQHIFFEDIIVYEAKLK